MRVRSAIWLTLGCLLAFQSPVVSQQLIDRQRALDAINTLPIVTIPRESCNSDGTPNGIDEDQDGATDENCRANPTCTFTLSPTTVSLTSATATGVTALTAAPANCAPNTWTAAANVAWISTGTDTGAGSGVIGYTVASNGSTSARVGTMTIAGQTFTVNQAGAPITPTPDIVFQDRFEYDISRSDVTAVQRFMAQGWSGGKSSQSAPGASGYLYTTTTVPGFTGAFPGGGSRVLAMEAVPNGGQTDFYLQLGGSGSQWEDYIPGDVWVQFWVYMTPESLFGCREKFFYVCNTDYPCHSHLWMIMAGACSYNRANHLPAGFPSQGAFLFSLRSADGVSTITNTQSDPVSNLGSQNVAAGVVRHSQWTLVKMHFNTTSTNGSSWEVWIRPQGGTWTKTSEFIAGQTPGLTWSIPAASVGGHRVFRWPTTNDYNKRLFFDDFVIARTEAALPIY